MTAVWVCATPTQTTYHNTQAAADKVADQINTAHRTKHPHRHNDPDIAITYRIEVEPPTRHTGYWTRPRSAA